MEISPEHFGPGTWWISSNIDPHWIAEGIGLVGGGQRPAEVGAKIEELKKELGDPPPDLEWGYERKQKQ